MSRVNTSVLVVEDEPQMRKFLRASLSSRGFRLIEAETAREAMQLATSHTPELILLDLGLPDGDGIELTQRIREWSQVPILVLSARGREEDKVRALDSGADDYLTKPFGIDELLARMRVALRHAQARSRHDDENAIFELRGLRIDRARREVWIDDREVKLTPIEYKLLCLFANHAGKVLTHRQILKEVWGSQHSAQAHHVRVHMADLRKKIEKDPARPKLIVTESGVGYRLRDEAG